MRRRLSESVKLRLKAEVPLGAFLSGGVDSSAVVAAMAQLDSQPVNTCSIGFDDPKFNETEFAKMVADRYKTNHRVEVVGSDDFGLVDTLAHLYDEPYADSSAIPTYRVCELARKHVTVALSGDGGDETFGGYRRYKMHMMEERMRSAFPLAVRRGVLRRWPSSTQGRLGTARLPRQDHFQAIARSSVDAYFNTMGLVRDPMREQLFSSKLKRELQGWNAVEIFHDHARRAGTDDPLALIQYIDLHTYLPGDINTKVDRASMAHSLEVRRTPDGPPARQWAATLPSSLKLRGQEGKYFFKKAMGPCCRMTCSTGPRWASPCRWRAGCVGRCVRPRAMHYNVARWLIRAGSSPRPSRACSTSTSAARWTTPAAVGAADVRRLPAQCGSGRRGPAGWALISTRTKDEGFGFRSGLRGRRVMRPACRAGSRRDWRGHQPLKVKLIASGSRPSWKRALRS